MLFELVKKVGLLNQVKYPIGAKRTFQIYENDHELAKASGQDNKWWKDNSLMLLFGENEGGGCEKKTRKVPLD